MLCGDIESNSGQRPKSSHCFQFVTGALTAANNVSKISLLKAYNVIYTYNIICHTETYLNHDTLFDDDNLRILGYKLIWVEHPSNQKRGGICIHHK